MFTERYQQQQTPWDTGITPPEIVAICEELPPGKALDLGCGTGTTIHHLLARGWQVDGIDFVAEAIERAQAKLAVFPPGSFSVQCHDVTRLDTAPGLRPPYDLVIDIGCGHGLPVDQQEKYARDIAALLATGGAFMLFAHYTVGEDEASGWKPADVRRLFTPHFELAWQALSDDTTTGRPSGWYRLVKSG